MWVGIAEITFDRKLSHMTGISTGRTDVTLTVTVIQERDTIKRCTLNGLHNVIVEAK